MGKQARSDEQSAKGKVANSPPHEIAEPRKRGDYAMTPVEVDGREPANKEASRQAPWLDPDAKARARRMFGFKEVETSKKVVVQSSSDPASLEQVRSNFTDQKKTQMKFERVEDFTNFMTMIAANVTGHPLLDDTLSEELGKFLKSHFERARAAQTPPVPERKYVPRKDEIIPFLREVWGEWLADDKLTKQVLKDNDTPAYNALSNWQRNNDLPDGMTIKTLADLNDEFLQWGYYRRDEVHRVASALARRGLDA